MAIAKTKNSYANFKGLISGLHRKKGSSKNDYDWGTRLQFFIKTSEFNSIPVTITAFANNVGGNVYFSTTNRDAARETKKMDWSDRKQEFEGWELIGIHLRASNYDNVDILVEQDAIDYILENFKDGDPVFVQCRVERNTSGDRTYTNYDISRMYSSAEFNFNIENNEYDFNAEDFKEVAEVRDTFVYREMAVNEDRALVKGTVVGNNSSLTEIEYMVDPKSEFGGDIIEFIKSNCSFGDVLTVEGIVHNRVVGSFVEKEGSGSLVGKSASSFGGSGVKFVVESERKELEMIGIVDMVKDVYTKDDLTVKEFDWLV